MHVPLSQYCGRGIFLSSRAAPLLIPCKALLTIRFHHCYSTNRYDTLQSEEEVIENYAPYRLTKEKGENDQAPDSVSFQGQL
jgi:hypothetical protein